MKCINCGNLIVDESTVCPICKVQVTPVVPVQQPVQQAVASVVQEPVPQVATEQPVMEQPVVQPAVEPVLEQAPVEQPVVENQLPTTYTASPEAFNIPVMTAISPTGEATDMQDTGVKLTNTKPDEQPKKDNKKRNIIIAIIAIVVVLIIGLGSGYYVYEYKTADIRVQKIYDAITKFTDNITNEEIELSSGKYELDFGLSYNNQTLQTKVNGIYARDLENELLDVTANIESFIFPLELIDEPISLEWTLIENNQYILFQNFFEKYIYAETDVLKPIFEVIQQNDLNYKTVINTFRLGLLNALKEMNVKQSVGDVRIGSKTKGANILTYNINEQNRIIATRSICNTFLKNKNAIEELSKFTRQSKEDITQMFKNIIKSGKDFYTYMLLQKYDEDIVEEKVRLIKPMKLEFYTAKFGESFYGLKFEFTKNNKKNVLEYIPQDDTSLTITLNEYGNKIFELNTKEDVKRSTAYVESTDIFVGTYYKDKVAYNFDIVLKTTSDVNPKVVKPNVKKSIRYNALTKSDYKEILNNMKSFGKFGLLFSSQLDEWYEKIMNALEIIEPEKPVTPQVTVDN